MSRRPHYPTDYRYTPWTPERLSPRDMSPIKYAGAQTGRWPSTHATLVELGEDPPLVDALGVPLRRAQHTSTFSKYSKVTALTFDTIRHAIARVRRVRRAERALDRLEFLATRHTLPSANRPAWARHRGVLP